MATSTSSCRCGASRWAAPSGRAGAGPRRTTTRAASCSQPALSPDGRNLAMICNYGKQVSYLTIATWNGSALGPLQTVISDQLVAQPIWAPDGSGIAYLAPGGPAAPFQLWWLPRARYAPPAPSPAPSAAPAKPVVKPIQVTTNLGFDATSPLAWLS